MTSYGMYVGRVGALAVALGVGMAVATSPGVAWATPDAGTDANSATGSADSTASGSTANATGTATEPTSSTTSGSTATTTTGTATASTTTGSTTSTSSAPSSTPSTAADTEPPSGTTETSSVVGDGVVVRSSGGAHTSTGTTPPTQATAATPTLTAPTTAPARQQLWSVTPTTEAKPTVTQSLSPKISTLLSPGVDTNQIDPQPTTLRVSTFAAAAPAPVPAPPDPIKAFLALPAAIINTAANVVKTVLASFAAPTPGAPADPPLLWAVLAVVRREFFNQTPEVNYTASKPDALGNITISLDQTDADGDTLDYTATNGDKGTVALNADGHSFTYTPTAGQTGTDTVTITASDARMAYIHGLPGLLNALSFGLLGDAGQTATANVTVTLNTPPTLTLTPSGPNQSTGAVTVTAVAVDADGDPLSFTITPPAGGSGTVGTATLIDGATGTYAIVYTPSEQVRHTASADNAAPQTDSFTVTISDGHGATVTKTADVAIAPGNAAPQFSTVSSSTDTDAIVTGTIVFTDSDSDSLTYSGSVTTSKGSAVVHSDGSFSYTPSSGERYVAAAIDGADTDTFTITVTDGHGGIGTHAVTVTITPATVPSNPSPDDVASDPQTALSVAQSIVMADSAALTTARATLTSTLLPRLTAGQQAQQDQLIAQAQLLLQAASQANAQAITDLNVGIVSSAVSTFGLTDGDLSALKAQGAAITASQTGLWQSLVTSAEARARIAAQSASAPVFDRIEYTVGADLSITGRVYFVDNNGESLTYHGVGDTVNPWFDQSGSGAFFIPAPTASDYTRTLTFLVQANDTSGNVTRTQVTLDRSTRTVPPADTPRDQLLAAFASIGQGLGSTASAGFSSMDGISQQLDALRAQRAATTNESILQQLDDQIAEQIQLLTNVQTQLLTTLDQIQTSQTAAIARITQV